MTANITAKATKAGKSTGSVIPVAKAGRKAITDSRLYVDRAPLSWGEQDAIVTSLRAGMAAAPINVDDLLDPFDSDDPVAQARENLSACGIEAGENSSDVTILAAWHKATAITSPLRVAFSAHRSNNALLYRVMESFDGRTERREAQQAAAAKAKAKAEAKA